MKVKVKFYLPLTTIGITDSIIELEVEEGISVKKLLVRLAQKYPRLRQSYFSGAIKENPEIPFLIRINEKFAGLEEALDEGDCVEIFSPVGGG